MADQQFRGAVSKPVELESAQDEPEPNRNKKIRSFDQGALKQGGLEPVLETVVRRTKRPIKTEHGYALRLANKRGQKGQGR